MSVDCVDRVTVDVPPVAVVHPHPSRVPVVEDVRVRREEGVPKDGVPSQQIPPLEPVDEPLPQRFVVMPDPRGEHDVLEHVVEDPLPDPDTVEPEGKQIEILLDRQEPLVDVPVGSGNHAPRVRRDNIQVLFLDTEIPAELHGPTGSDTYRTQQRQKP
jgi:hypothetical protein